MQVKIKKATERDLPSLMKLRKELWADCSNQKHLQEIKRQLSSRKKAIFLASFGQKRVGFAEISIKNYAEKCPEGPIGYLEGIYVQIAYRRNGIAKQIIEVGEEWCLKKNCLYMASDAELWNKASIKFHEGLGYEIINKLVHFRKKIK